MDEEALVGGNTTAVVRIGDTVRRVPGKWTPTVRRLLTYIRDQGMDAVPEPLGIDSRGREILSFVDGDVGHYPLPPYMWSAETLESVARLFRRLHEATAGFPPERGDHWRFPEHPPIEVICHNDLAPYNVVFRNGHPAGIIDFDAASPGSRAWDLAHAAYRFVPLADPANPEVPVVPLPVQAARLGLMLESYGSEVDRAEVVDLLPQRLEALIESTGVQAEAEQGARRDLLKEHRNIYERDLLYIRKHQDVLALSPP